MNSISNDLILSSIGMAISGFSIKSRELFLYNFLKFIKEQSFGYKPVAILDCIHEICKVSNAEIWENYLNKNSSSKVNNGIYLEFKFKEDKIISKARYFIGQKYAKELATSEKRYTKRVLSLESDGLYLNHKKVQVI